jgi:muramoyltetrapeptide carboxypeptidase
MDRAEQVMAGLGLRVSYGAHAAAITDDGMSAGTARQRADDFMEAFTDPSVDAVFSAYGGASAHELVSMLDTAALRGADKAFIGNSDNVWLHHYLYQETGLSSYFGVTYIGELGEFGGPFPETLQSFRQAVMSPGDLVCRPAPLRSDDFSHHAQPDTPRRHNRAGGWHWLRPGLARGPLVGGEIGTLVELARHFNLKLDGCVLFWDVRLRPGAGESGHGWLAELADLVALDRLAGMVVGPDVRHTPDGWSRVVADMLAEILPGTTYPVLVNADVGHLDPKWVVPYGRNAVLDSGVVFPR